MDIIKFIASVISEDVDTPTKPATKPATTPSRPKEKPEFKPFNPPKPRQLPEPKANTPTKPAPRPITTPSRPKERPEFKPFNPPRPAKDPSPKMRLKRQIGEAFDQDAERSTVDFWQNIRNSEHPYKSHPILALYGYESASKAFDHGIEKLLENNPQLRNMSQRQAIKAASEMAFQAVMEVMQIEHQHIRELERLAVGAVAQTWGIPPEMLQAHITRDIQDEDGAPAEVEFEEDDEIQPEDLPPTDKIRHQINKRITMNALTQGAAVHNMATLHHVVAQELEQISPQLLELYQQFASGSTSMYWMMDFVNITKLALKANIVGTSEVEYGQDEDEDEEEDVWALQDAPDEEIPEYEPEVANETGQPTIIGKGFNFPVLIQELVKGVMELLSHHGLSGMNAEELDTVYKSADRVEDEPWLIQVGPHIWRSFLKIVPKGSSLATVVAKIAQQDPKYIHDLLAKTIEAVHRGEDPAEAREALVQLLQDHDDEEPGYEESDDEEYGEDDDTYQV